MCLIILPIPPSTCLSIFPYSLQLHLRDPQVHPDHLQYISRCWVCSWGLLPVTLAPQGSVPVLLIRRLHYLCCRSTAGLVWLLSNIWLFTRRPTTCTGSSFQLFVSINRETSPSGLAPFSTWHFSTLPLVNFTLHCNLIQEQGPQILKTSFTWGHSSSCQR